jgi:hypothetical protein
MLFIQSGRRSFTYIIGRFGKERVKGEIFE